MIYFHADRIVFKIQNQRKISDWLNKIIYHYKRILGEINVIFCSDEYILEMNQTHLNHDYYTDIITFNFNHFEYVSGDLYISVDRVKENAEEFNVTFNQEIQRVLVHGLLHLLGFNDTTDQEEAEIRKLENHWLQILENEFLNPKDS